MRHGIAGRKLNRKSSHRIALLKNLSKSLIVNEQIETTLPKAKDLRPAIMNSQKFDKSTDENEGLIELNRKIEQLIYEHPEEYLWGYDRFKMPK